MYIADSFVAFSFIWIRHFFSSFFYVLNAMCIHFFEMYF